MANGKESLTASTMTYGFQKTRHPSIPDFPELTVLDVEKAQAYFHDVLGFEIAWTCDDKSIGAVERDGPCEANSPPNSPLDIC